MTDQQQQRKSQQQKPKKAGPGGLGSKAKDSTMNYIVIPESDLKIYYKDIEDVDRTNLRGGGICKKGMNKKARGRNS